MDDPWLSSPPPTQRAHPGPSQVVIRSTDYLLRVGSFLRSAVANPINGTVSRRSLTISVGTMSGTVLSAFAMMSIWNATIPPAMEEIIAPTVTMATVVRRFN